MRQRAVLISSLVLLAALASGYWLVTAGYVANPFGSAAAPTAAPTGGGQQRPPSPVEVAVAERRTFSQDLPAIGSLEAERSADIAAEGNGRIAAILFRDGARVAAGAELYRLDGALIAAQAADAEARLKLAQTSYDRNQTLVRSRNVAQSVFDQAVAELAQAQSALELVRVQQQRLSIRAPFDGFTGFSAKSIGDYVTAGEVLVHLEHIDALKVSFSVPELSYSQVKSGGAIALTADAVPGQTFEGTISAIDPLIDVNGRALRVQAMIGNADLKLRPGMLARITVVGPAREAVAVPEAAIVPLANQLTVFQVIDNAAKNLKVQTGQRRDGFVEIVEGLEAGATVVTAGATRLGQGGPVRVVPPPQSAQAETP